MANRKPSKPIEKEVLVGYIIKPEELRHIQGFIQSLPFNINQKRQYEQALITNNILANLQAHTEKVEETPPKKAE